MVLCCSMWSLTQLYGHDHDGAMTCFHGIGNALRHLAGLQPISYEQNLLLACKRNRSSKTTIARLIRCAGTRGLENWRGPSVKGGIESVRQQGGRVGSELSLLSFSLSLGHLQLRSSSQ
eukprot:COSAG06_NODE_18863_length_863_cov_6.586928_1_plen_118_part_10